MARAVSFMVWIHWGLAEDADMKIYKHRHILRSNIWQGPGGPISREQNYLIKSRQLKWKWKSLGVVKMGLSWKKIEREEWTQGVTQFHHLNVSAPCGNSRWERNSAAQSRKPFAGGRRATRHPRAPPTCHLDSVYNKHNPCRFPTRGPDFLLLASQILTAFQEYFYG